MTKNELMKAVINSLKSEGKHQAKYDASTLDSTGHVLAYWVSEGLMTADKKTIGDARRELRDAGAAKETLNNAVKIVRKCLKSTEFGECRTRDEFVAKCAELEIANRSQLVAYFSAKDRADKPEVSAIDQIKALALSLAKKDAELAASFCRDAAAEISTESVKATDAAESDKVAA